MDRNWFIQGHSLTRICGWLNYQRQGQAQKRTRSYSPLGLCHTIIPESPQTATGRPLRSAPALRATFTKGPQAVGTERISPDPLFMFGCNRHGHADLLSTIALGHALFLADR